MIVVLDGALPKSGSVDLRRAARRARDAWRAAARPGDVVAESEDSRAQSADAKLIVREAAALVPEGALRAAIEALEQGMDAVAVSGFFPGAAASVEPYATVWEFDGVAARLGEQATKPNGGLRADGTEPVELRRMDAGDAVAQRLTPFVVHSFAGRRGHSRPEVVPLIPASARNVLDVGCGEGALGESLAARGLDVTGVEADPEAAAIAATRLRRVVDAPLEESWDELGERFDVVLACDLLEHLEDPIAALRSLRSRLRDNGVLILSVPNGSNTSVLAGALMGRWDPALEGIVADDHRTYSGRLGWERVLRAGGFRIERWEVSAVQAPPRLAPWHQALCAAGVPAEEFTAVQWLGVARGAPGSEPLELGASALGGGGLDADDPVRAVARSLERETSATHTLVNAASALALGPLFRGEEAKGPSRAALVGGVTRHGLTARFAASGIAVDIEPVGECLVTPAIEAVCKKAISLGLPVDEAGLRTAAWRATFTRGRLA